MIKQLKIKAQNKDCKIIIENNAIKKYLKLEINKNSKTFIIVDSKISKNILKIVKSSKKIEIIKVNGSEKIKSINYYNKIVSLILKKNIKRSSTIIAIGGGTIGDLSGFVASTILRGVRFVLMPTTLLSQVDSSVGGKNGINFKFGKNLLGTFYQPELVIIDPSILKSLSKRQIMSGYAEILKHSLINDKKFYNWLKENYKDLLSIKKSKLLYAISKSILIKLKYVKKDEKEKLINSSSRAMLNFGHTFGHAIESLNNYKSNLTHGEAISIGMYLASKISYNLKNITELEFKDITKHLINSGLLKFKKNLVNDKIFNKIISDKKNLNNKINLILLKKIGSACYKRGLTIKNIKKLIN